MNKKFMSLLALILLGCPQPGTLALETTRGSDEKSPNIVFLLTDDQSFNSLGCYGNVDVKTPNIDQLAGEGFIFDRHYDTTAICMASRANIFTGLYEYRTGCNFGYENMSRKMFDQSYPNLLRKSGYLTAFAGKFGMTIDGVGLPENDFDYWGGGPGQTFYETARNKSMVRFAKDFPHSTLAYGAFAQASIRDSVRKKKPFCISISFKAPHRPVSPDPRFDQVYAGTRFKKPENFGRENGDHLSKQSQQGRQFERFHSWNYSDNYNEVMRKYHQQIHAVDAAVGMIRKTVAEQGVAANTVFIFTSDNGFMCGSHGYGSKVLPYEESARVPLIIFDPRHKNRGKNFRIAAVTGNIDISPTLCAIAGVESAPDIDGKSLLPLLENPQADIHESLALMNFWGPIPTHSFGIVTRKWKYINWFYAGQGMKPCEELFDMQSDQAELKNMAIIAESQPALETLREKYDQIVGDIKTRGRTSDYRKYGTLFDRSTDWDTKMKLIKKK